MSELTTDGAASDRANNLKVDDARPTTTTDAPRTTTPPPACASRPRRRRRWLRRALLVVLILFFVAQLPFIYRAFQLRALRRTLAERHAARSANADPNFREYVGVIHTHTALGGHSTGTLSDVIRAARAEQLDFVVMTEHTEGDYDTAALTLSDKRGGTLFIPGNETQTADGARFLVLPGASETGEAGRMSAPDFTHREQSAGRAVFVAYPSELSAWEAANYDGIEVYNLFTDARRANRFTLFFDSLWSPLHSPDLVFARFYQRPADALARADKHATKRADPLALLAGADAHANVGIHLQLASGERLAGVQLDSYARSFRIVRQHVLLPAGEELTADTLLAALRAGRSFIAFDIFGDARGFRFTARNDRETRTMGELIAVDHGEIQFNVRVPVASRIVLLRNGEQLAERRGTDATFTVSAQQGAYRTEIFHEGIPLLADKPWILSNYIYVGK